MATPAYTQHNQSNLEEIAARLDMYDLASRYTQLKKSSNRYVGRCPFPDHNDGTPSFVVYKDHFNCFGCGRAGSPINFIRYIEGITFGEAVKRAKDIAGMPGQLPPKKKVATLVENVGWQDPEWQAFAELHLARSIKNMTGVPLATFKEGRGLNDETIKRFEVGYTGNAKVTLNLKGSWLVIPAKAYIFPVRNSEGKIKLLKWRNTQQEEIESRGKYGALKGGETGLFNFDRAISQDSIIICTGEFEVMVLAQLGFEALCMGGENRNIDFSLFGDKPLFYIADRDTRGKEAADKHQRACPRLLVTYPNKPFKDLTDQSLSPRGLTRIDVENLLTGAKPPSGTSPKGRRLTRLVDAPDDPEDERPALELEAARLELVKTATTIYAHPRLSRSEVLQVASQPGTGKGHTFNEEATRAAANHESVTLWTGPRLDMYHDQERPKDWWKQIIGRRAARNSDGDLVDFNSELAIQPGNCTVAGEKYHEVMFNKGWERESHKYCEYACPARMECNESGYLSQLKRDGRNAYATFAHLFTSTPGGYNFLTIDEPRYQDFVDIKEISDGDLGHLIGFTFNGGMLAIIKAIRDMLTAPRQKRTALELDTLEEEAGEFAESDNGAYFKLSGLDFYKELDTVCRRRFKSGLLDLIDRAQASGGWFTSNVMELLEERSVQAAEKLPPNLWKPLMGDPEPGTGGLYDVIKAEAKMALAGLPLSFVSRLELVKASSNKSAKLILHRRRNISGDFSGKPTTVLNATGNASLLKLLLTTYKNAQTDKELKRSQPIWRTQRPLIRTVAPNVELPAQVEIVQDTRRNYSKQSLLASLAGKDGGRYWRVYIQQTTSYLKPGVKTLVVCSMAVEDKVKKELETRGYTAARGYSISVEHYGNLRGSNKYQDCELVVETGLYMPQPEAVIRAGRALYGGDGRELETEMSRVARIYDYKIDGSQTLADDVLCFKDDRLQTLLEQDREEEHLQVAYRIRPLGTTKPKKIVLLFGIPIPGLKPDLVIYTDQDGDYREVNQRTKTVLTKAQDGFISLTRDYPLITPQILARETGLALSTTYKYFESAAVTSGFEITHLECIESLPRNRGEIPRSLLVAVKSGIPRDLTSILNSIRGMPKSILPNNWRLAPEPEVITRTLAPLPQIPVLEVTRERWGEYAFWLEEATKHGSEFENHFDQGNLVSAGVSRERHNLASAEAWKIANRVRPKIRI